MSDQIKPENQSEFTLPNNITESDLEISTDREAIPFQTHCQGIMIMYATIDKVAEYLNHHEGWFVRCAAPMKAEPFGDDGYTMTIGRYGAFGYEVEPKMSVILEPPNNYNYLMYSVDNPECNQLGYEVDYKSKMNIEEVDSLQTSPEITKLYKKQNIAEVPPFITCINWKLDLQVRVKFPNFIYKLPVNLIVTTGDRLLNQIVKQISPRLSYKVQKDFHSRFNLPIPPKSGRTCEIIDMKN